MSEAQDNYTIRIKQFEGPFDLLLFFIERDEIDIMDIPISRITDDFLAYIRKLETLNIDVASEFILVAATLMRIKARMLLPRPELSEDGLEIDPRVELAQKLLEYKRFKDVLDDLANMEEERQKMNARGNSKQELKSLAAKALVDIELESLTLFSLFKSFENVMKQFDTRKNRPKHVVYKYNYTIEQQREYIIEKVKARGATSFEDIFTGLDDRIHCIITFLSLLELINAQFIRISNGMSINNFIIEPVKA